MPLISLSRSFTFPFVFSDSDFNQITRKNSDRNLNLLHSEQLPLLHTRSLQNLNPVTENGDNLELSYKIDHIITEILFQKGQVSAEQLKMAWQREESILTNGDATKERLIGHLLLKNLLIASESVKEKDVAFKFAAILTGSYDIDNYERRKLTSTSTIGGECTVSQV